MIEREMRDIMKTTKIVIFIDDLDRCSPKKALEVLESIKVFLDIEGFIYVIGLSEDKVVQLIEVAYKEVGIKGVEYLQKIIQLQMVIPSWDPDIEELIEKTLKYKLDREYSDVIVKNKDLIAMSMQSNPRQVKRFINRFIVSHQNSIQADSRPDHNEFLILEILKQIWPAFYDKISDKTFLEEVKNYLRKENNNRTKDLNILISRKDSKDNPLTDVEKKLINFPPDSRLWDFLSKTAKRRIIFAMDEERIENLEKKVGTSTSIRVSKRNSQNESKLQDKW